MSFDQLEASALAFSLYVGPGVRHRRARKKALMIIDDCRLDASFARSRLISCLHQGVGGCARRGRCLQSAFLRPRRLFLRSLLCVPSPIARPPVGQTPFRDVRHQQRQRLAVRRRPRRPFVGRGDRRGLRRRGCLPFPRLKVLADRPCRAAFIHRVDIAGRRKFTWKVNWPLLNDSARRRETPPRTAGKVCASRPAPPNVTLRRHM